MTVMCPVKRTPAYLKIQAIVREQIESGRLKVGDVVSSERKLARKHHVSLMTARHALSGLEREGLVERRHGAGSLFLLSLLSSNCRLNSWDSRSRPIPLQPGYEPGVKTTRIGTTSQNGCSKSGKSPLMGSSWTPGLA
jgi:DNA-binding transcriptional MocR family regulator